MYSRSLFQFCRTQIFNDFFIREVCSFSFFTFSKTSTGLFIIDVHLLLERTDEIKYFSDVFPEINSHISLN